MDIYTATEQAFKNGYEKGYAKGQEDAMNSIVRCKDCKHYVEIPYNDEKRMCVFWDEWVFTNEEDFCSRGERKNNG